MTKRNQHLPLPSLAWILCLALVTAFTNGCSSTGSISSIQTVPASPDVLRVGVTPALPPMIFKEGDVYQGIEAQLAEALAKRLGRRLVFVEVPWEQQIDALLQGKTDIIMSSMSITAVRQARINFSRPYMRSGQVALVRRAEIAKMQLFLLSEKNKVGVQKGTTGEFFAELNMAKSKRVIFRDPDKAAEALVKNRIDSFISDATVNWWLSSKYEAKGLAVLPQLLQQEMLGWGVRKQDTDLLQAANDFLNEAEADGSLNAIIRNWIPNFSVR